MIKVFVGKNANGKTRYIKDILRQAFKDNKVISTNLGQGGEPKTELDSNLIKSINMRTDAFELQINPDGRTVSFLYCQMSEAFMHLVRLILYKVDIIILDEPELGIDELEFVHFVDILHCIDNVDIMMTTHSDILASQFEDDLYNIVNGELVKVTYEDTDCM
jgi:Fe-S cluster assembly ATPase SufC